ncbi:MAG: hypothetical protein ACRCVL_03515 [Cetobacterium sp.]
MKISYSLLKISFCFSSNNSFFLEINSFSLSLFFLNIICFSISIFFKSLSSIFNFFLISNFAFKNTIGLNNKRYIIKKFITVSITLIFKLKLFNLSLTPLKNIKFPPLFL